MRARLWRIPYLIVRILPFRAKVLMNHFIAKHFLVGLIALVVNENHEFLVLHHTYRPNVPYGLPSGWLKRGETPSDAMAREIREESSFNAQFVRIIKAETKRPPTRLDLWMLFRLVDGTFRPSPEANEALWVTPETAPPLLTEQRDFLAQHWNQLQSGL